MTSAAKAKGNRAESLERWLTFLHGDPQLCKCDYVWETSLKYGGGWVRTTTHPSCPIHALCQGYTAESEAAYKRTHPWSIGRWCPVHLRKGCPA